jgi:RimJ/RimL family protein N-acetyltransferase
LNYKKLNNQVFVNGRYSLVPIRAEDRYEIMKWRNEQIYHLRQAKPLTIKDQDCYFDEVLSKLFDQEQPNQILFSFLEGDTCVGYGGLVHINWIDKNAEISFIMNTQLEKEYFELLWTNYLILIKKIALTELNLHKIYTYAFDLRPHLYQVLEKNNFQKEAVLKEHCLFDGKFIDVVIHCTFSHEPIC